MYGYFSINRFNMPYTKDMHASRKKKQQKIQKEFFAQ